MTDRPTERAHNPEVAGNQLGKPSLHSRGTSPLLSLNGNLDSLTAQSLKFIPLILEAKRKDRCQLREKTASYHSACFQITFDLYYRHINLIPKGET